MKTETKRQNFNITPEQEAEIAWLKDAIDAPTVKDAILQAVRVLSVLARGRQRGFEVFLENGEGEREKVLVPGLERNQESEWKYLAPRPQPSKNQLYVMGRRLTAYNVWMDMLVNKRTREETADDWDLPIEAVDEIIRYCEQNAATLGAQADAEKQWLIDQGVEVEPPAAHRRRLAG